MNVSELREFIEFELSNLEAGSSCLTRHEDGIWYPAKIKGRSMVSKERASIYRVFYSTYIGRVGNKFTKLFEVFKNFNRFCKNVLQLLLYILSVINACRPDDR